MVLLRIPNILTGLPPEIAADLFANSTRRHLPAGAVLFEENEAGDGCYRVDQGVVKVSLKSPQGEETILSFVGRGGIVGELAVLDGLPRSASVAALKDCQLSFVSRAAFESCAARYPAIYESLVSLMATRLRDTNNAIAAMAFLTGRGRVARALMEIAESFGEESESGSVLIQLKISHRDIAAMAGVARESASRILSEWERLKLVTKSAGHYRIADKAKLAREIS